MQYRRFGKTGLDIPVISCGGMRYQQSWKTGDPVTEESQRNLEACIRRAIELGINHIETARGYGTSEEQLGRVLPLLPRDEIIVQTKVGPSSDPEKFSKTFEESMGYLRLDYVDLLAFHGVNHEESYQNTLKCLDQALKWKEQGRIRHLGFSTHGATDVIIKTIQTDVMEYVNLHWYYIFQDNWPAVLEARKRDMGVFIISPNDKGGLLYKPAKKLCELTAPLHPIVFNDLFCLMHPEVHTLSCGAAKPEDFDHHIEAVKLLDRAKEVVPPIVARIESAMSEKLGSEWIATWKQGLPRWEDTPGEINIPVILQMYNLARGLDMVEYGKMRYNMLGNGGDWFPGRSAAELESVDLSGVLEKSPNAAQIPGFLAQAHQMLKGEEKKRLQTDE